MIGFSVTYTGGPPLEELDEIDQFNKGSSEFPTSESLGDPPMDIVLRWHIANCEWCASIIEARIPLKFGQKSEMCPEYMEIIEEYAEYEGKFAWLGNP